MEHGNYYGGIWPISFVPLTRLKRKNIVLMVPYNNMFYVNVGLYYYERDLCFQKYYRMICMSCVGKWHKSEMILTFSAKVEPKFDIDM